MKVKTNIVFTFCILSFFYNQIAFAEKTPFIKELELLDKFGGLDVPSEQILANPVDIAISDEGLIYILDSEDNDIKIFKQDGTFIKHVGRRGNGPGEFVRPWAIYIIKAEEYQKIYENFRKKNESDKSKGIFWYLYYIYDLAMDERGNLFILLNDPSRMIIYVYSNDGVFKRKLFGVEDSIFRIEVTSNNHMYALSQETHLIYKFKLDFE